MTQAIAAEVGQTACHREAAIGFCRLSHAGRLARPDRPGGLSHCGTVVKRMLSEVRHALRTILQSPVFAISTILTLALGVGANTGAFSALNTLLLKPLPYPDPHR